VGKQCLWGFCRVDPKSFSSTSRNFWTGRANLTSLYLNYTCQLFFSKLREIFRLHSTWISEDLPTASEDCRRFLKTPKIAEDFRRLPKIAEYFPMTSKRITSHNLNMSWCHEINMRNRVSFEDAFLRDSPIVLCRKKIECLFNRFLSNYTCYCQLGARNRSECVRSQV